MIDESEIVRLSGLREQSLSRGDLGLVREIEAHMLRHGVDPAACVTAGSTPGVLEQAVPQGSETVTPPKRGPGRPRKRVG